MKADSKAGLYLSRADMKGHYHYVVRVPKPGGGYWPRETFSVKLYGEDAARALATRRRDFFISQSAFLPTGLIYSKSASEVDTETLARLKRLFKFQLEYSQVRLSTVAMLAMFAGTEATCRDIAEAIDREPINMARQVRLLEKKGWLTITGRIQGIGRPSVLYTLSTSGLAIVRAFRACMGVPDGQRLRPSHHYAQIVMHFGEGQKTIGPASLAVLGLIAEGVTAVSEMARVVDAAPSEISAAISRLVDRELLQGSRTHLNNQSGTNPTWSRPVYELTDNGQHLLALFRSM